MTAVINPAPRAAVTRLARGANAVMAAVQGLEPGGRIVGVTKGAFSLLDMIEAVLAITGPGAVTVSTWTPGKQEMERVIDMLRHRRIASFRLLVDRSFPGRHPEYLELIRRLVPASEIRLTRTHAKFALIASGDWRIAIRTSMNFNTNPRLEQFDLDDDPEIYEFFEQVTDALFAHIPEGVEVSAHVVSAKFRSAFV